MIFNELIHTVNQNFGFTHTEPVYITTYKRILGQLSNILTYIVFSKKES